MGRLLSVFSTKGKNKSGASRPSVPAPWFRNAPPSLCVCASACFVLRALRPPPGPERPSRSQLAYPSADMAASAMAHH